MRWKVLHAAISSAAVGVLIVGIAPASASGHSLHREGEEATSGAINPTLGFVTIAGPDGNPVVDPATRQPFLVDLDALNTPPARVPANADANAVSVATHQVGTESYIVPSYVAAQTLVDAR